jgi:hypothetical protein
MFHPKNAELFAWNKILYKKVSSCWNISKNWFTMHGLMSRKFITYVISFWHTQTEVWDSSLQDVSTVDVYLSRHLGICLARPQKPNKFRCQYLRRKLNLPHCILWNKNLQDKPKNSLIPCPPLRKSLHCNGNEKILNINTLSSINTELVYESKSLCACPWRSLTVFELWFYFELRHPRCVLDHSI